MGALPSFAEDNADHMYFGLLENVMGLSVPPTVKDEALEAGAGQHTAPLGRSSDRLSG